MNCVYLKICQIFIKLHASSVVLFLFLLQAINEKWEKMLTPNVKPIFLFKIK